MKRHWPWAASALLLAAAMAAVDATAAERRESRAEAARAASGPGLPVYEIPARMLFEADSEGWAVFSGEDGANARIKAAVAAAPGREGKALAFAAEFPGETRMVLARPINLSRRETLQFEVFFDADLGGVSEEDRPQAAVFVKDDEFHWYQTATLFRLPAGRWARCRVDISNNSAAWAAVNHRRPWSSYAARRVEELGIKFFSKAAFSARIHVDNIVFAGEAAQPPQELINYRVNAETVPRFGLFEAAFELTRFYANPFDPEQIEVKGVFIAPNGDVTEVPGFFYQDYARRLERNVELLTPVGRSEWRIRFAPREEGVYSYFIEASDGEVLRTQPRQFSCAASDNPGYVRVSRSDRRYFEFENGDFFYPIGHNIPATFNSKGAAKLGVEPLPFRGTFAYDDYLEKMRGAGENFARVWLASWSFGLEWSRKYDAHYHGLGEYNLENAWRLDYTLDKARRSGVYTQLALTTFGAYSSGDEGDWRYSPYNRDNGGFLNEPKDFWTSARARKYYQRMLRYVCARWGYDTHIAGWELCNEVDLITPRNFGLKGELIPWHKDCVNVLRRYDHGRHLATTNFSYWQLEPALLGLEEIAYSSTNWYHVQIVDEMRKIAINKMEYKKPAIMAECGVDFNGSTAENTERYIQICIWSSHMMPFAGSGMQWWWDFIEDRNLYRYWTPLARFAAGEDRRGRGLEMYEAKVEPQPAEAASGDAKEEAKQPRLRALCLRNQTSGYLWIYDTAILDAYFQPPARLNADKSVILNGMSDGVYRAEIWDTTTGEVAAAPEFVSRKGEASFPLPPFRSNIAVKVKPAAP